MTAAQRSIREEIHAAGSIFEQILVGVDGSALSFDACRQAVLLAEPGALIEAAAVSLYPPAAAAALGVDDLAITLERDAGAVLLATQRILGPSAELRQLHGLTVDALLNEVNRVQPTLLAIGAPERTRVEEIVLGGVGGELLHLAPCSMLLARPVPDEANFPRSIVVGIDGSDEAERAYEVAVSLARRRHGRVQSLAALGGKCVDLGEIAHRHSRVDASDAPPVPALVEASGSADLVVVGSRGLHGLRALGSVSERIAHQAACSVLVVR
jgi:nucleotide-binding universal stress UspA family protein